MTHRFIFFRADDYLSYVVSRARAPVRRGHGPPASRDHAGIHGPTGLSSGIFYHAFRGEEKLDA